MADASKLKPVKISKKTLGQAPTIEEASNNIHSPEVAPAHNQLEAPRLDGRSMRRSAKTARFATSITPECDQLLRKIAFENNMMLADVLEEALKVYQTHLSSKS